MAHAAGGDDTPTLLPMKGEHETGAEEQNFDKLRDAYYWSRLLAGDDQLDLTSGPPSCGARPAPQAGAIANATVKGPTRGGTWHLAGTGPDRPEGRTTNTFRAVSGRVGALADPQRRHDHPRRRTGRHLDLRRRRARPGPRGPRTPTPSRSAPWPWPRATTGSSTWAPAREPCPATPTSATASPQPRTAASPGRHVSSQLHRAGHLGPRRGPGEPEPRVCRDPPRPWRQPPHDGTCRATAYGIWESKNGGTSWTLRKGTTDELHGATDLVMDPQAPTHLWASFWGDGDLQEHGRRCHLDQSPWATCRPATSSRVAPGSPSGISHPAGAAQPTLYTGYDYFDLTDAYHGGADLEVASTAGTTWTERHWVPTTGSDSAGGLLHHAVLLRQRREARPDQPRCRLRPRVLRLQQHPAVRRRLPVDGWLARPGRTSATTCTPTSTRSPSSRPTPSTWSSATTVGCGSSQQRWWTPGRSGPVHCRLAGPQRHRRPHDGGPDPLHRSGHRPVHLDRHRPEHPRAVLGRYPGQRHAAQVAREQPLVRPGER